MSKVKESLILLQLHDPQKLSGRATHTLYWNWGEAYTHTHQPYLLQPAHTHCRWGVHTHPALTTAGCTSHTHTTTAGCTHTHTREGGSRTSSVWDLWLVGLCTCNQVIDPEFDPGHKSVLFYSLSACVSWTPNCLSTTRSIKNTNSKLSCYVLHSTWDWGRMVVCICACMPIWKLNCYWPNKLIYLCSVFLAT